jgi:hypothetical protein
MWGPALVVGLALAGAYFLNRSGVAAKLGPTVPGSGGDPEPKGPSDVRQGWNPRVLDVRKAARFAMVGCGLKWYSSTPIGGRTTNADGGLLYFPGFTPRYGSNLPFYGDCRPPAGSSAAGPGRLRSWWQSISGPSPTPATVPDTEYLAGAGDWQGPEGTAQIMGVTVGGELYARADQTLNWAALSVRGGVLWVGNVGWMATDRQGRDLANPVILYKGEPVPAASWPGALAPWSLVAAGSLRTNMVSKGQRHDAGGHVAPFDACAPVYVNALLSRPRVLVGELIP